MENLNDYLNELLNENENDYEIRKKYLNENENENENDKDKDEEDDEDDDNDDEEDDNDDEEDDNEDDDEILNKDDFIKYAKNKFKKVFKSDLDKDQMNDVIQGILDDNEEKVKNNEWGELIGILNKSFGK